MRVVKTRDGGAGRWVLKGLNPAAANKEEALPHSHVNHTNAFLMMWQEFPHNGISFLGWDNSTQIEVGSEACR
ncbi:hypothetical protein WM42_1184 [Corynebacterium simulans]|nr:hypothetical protein WM42_1184 [Corynebacterium simulans]